MFDELGVYGLVADILASVPVDSKRPVDRASLEEVADEAARSFSLVEMLVPVETAGECKRTLLPGDWWKTFSVLTEVSGTVGFHELSALVCSAFGMPVCGAMVAHFAVCVE